MTGDITRLHKQYNINILSSQDPNYVMLVDFWCVSSRSGRFYQEKVEAVSNLPQRAAVERAPDGPISSVLGPVGCDVRQVAGIPLDPVAQISRARRAVARRRKESEVVLLDA